MSFNFQIDSQVKVYATSGAFPATGVIRTIYIDKSSDTAYYWDDATSTYKSLGGGSASIVWGSITGTLADQTDLQNALNAKVPYSGATSNVDLGEYQIKAGQLELDQTPTGTTGIAKIRWNDTDGTIDVGLKGGNVTLQVGLEELVRVVNKSGASLAESAYQAVRVRLVSEGGAAGQRLAVVLAQANNDLNSATTIGVVTETIANNQEGFINRGGEVRGINTTGSLQGETWVDGDILYLSPTTPGALTNIKPTAPDHSITIGYVVYSHAVNGKIFVKVDNGYELEELHNVTNTDYNAPVDADSLLIYQSSESLWKRLTWANVKAKLKTYFDTVYQAVLVSGTNIKTINSTSVLGSGDIAVQPTLVSGTNIKTINGSSVLGSGNLSISGGGGIAIPTKPLSGGGYMTHMYNGGTTVNSVALSMTLQPFVPINSITVSAISFQVTTLQAGATAKIVVYSDNNGTPGTLIIESPTLDCSTIGFKTYTISYTFTAGTTYWTSVVFSAINVGATSNGNLAIIGTRTITNAVFNCFSTNAPSYPTIPPTLSLTTANLGSASSIPRITLIAV